MSNRIEPLTIGFLSETSRAMWKWIGYDPSTNICPMWNISAPSMSYLSNPTMALWGVVGSSISLTQDQGMAMAILWLLYS